MSRKSLLYGTAALAAVILILATPRAAHALAATLVQVTNTVANPAIAQSPNTQAAQLVALQSTSGFNTSGANGVSFSTALVSTYTVPAGQSLVITSVDIDSLASKSSGVGACATAAQLSITGSNFVTMQWYIAASAPHAHYEYPSGLVFSSGAQPRIYYGDGSATSPACGVIVYANGYLTAN